MRSVKLRAAGTVTLLALAGAAGTTAPVDFGPTTEPTGCCGTRPTLAT